MRALLVYNPTAGRGGLRREIPDAMTVLQAAGWLIMPAQTEGPGHAAELARQACVEGYDVVLVAGGDGTINQAADGLIGAARALACRSRRWVSCRPERPTFWHVTWECQCRAQG